MQAKDACRDYWHFRRGLASRNANPLLLRFWACDRHQNRVGLGEVGLTARQTASDQGVLGRPSPQKAGANRLFASSVF